MKNFKRIALMLIVIIMLATLNVYAGTAEVNLTSSATEVKVGDTVTITVSAKNTSGIEGINSTLEYDKTKLKLTNEEKMSDSGFTSLSGIDGLTGKFKLTLMYGGTDKAPQQADCAKLTFQVLSGTNVGENLNIKISEIELGGSDDDWAEDLSDKTVTLKVKSGTTEDNKQSILKTVICIAVIGGLILAGAFYIKKKKLK